MHRPQILGRDPSEIRYHNLVSVAGSDLDTDETGHRSDKAEVLRVLKSGALKLRKLELSEMKAYVSIRVW